MRRTLGALRASRSGSADRQTTAAPEDTTARWHKIPRSKLLIYKRKSTDTNAADETTTTTYFVYDADRELIDTTDADGRRTTYAYDQLGRETGETWLSSGTPIYQATFTYDADGEMTGADNPNATVTFTYDNGGNLETEATSGPGSGQPSVTLTYSYNPSGDVTSVTDSLSGSGALGQGITTYVYDHALRLTTITQSAGGTTGPEVTMHYDAAGLVTQTVFSNAGTGNDVVTQYAYDSAETLTTLTSYFSSEGQHEMPSPYATEDSTYNSAEQLTGLSITGITNSNNSYTYDADGQLTSSSGSSNITYSYDANGNRNSTGYTTGADNELTNSSGVTYTFDNDGNMITATTGAGTTTYTYDFNNRLTNVEINGTMAATYTYDALGRRIGIDDSGTQTWTVYNGKTADDNPYADFTGAGVLKMRYLDGPAVDEIFARTDSSGNTAWYLRDQVGSVDAVTTTTMVLDQIIYDPFGNIVTETNASEGDRFKFAGMEYDSVTGLYYDHARNYDAVVGRFASQDPESFAAGDTNLYRYVGNSVTWLQDTTGEQNDGLDVEAQIKLWVLLNGGDLIGPEPVSILYWPTPMFPPPQRQPPVQLGPGLLPPFKLPTNVPPGSVFSPVDGRIPLKNGGHLIITGHAKSLHNFLFTIGVER